MITFIEIWQQMQIQIYSEVTCLIQYIDPIETDSLERIALVDSHVRQHLGLYVRLLCAVSQANSHVVLLLNSYSGNTHWANDPGLKIESFALD